MVFSAERPVAIVGAGVIGTRVAWVCARAGLRTRLYDPVAGKAAANAAAALGWGSDGERDGVTRRLMAATSLAEALHDAQLAFENVPEDLDLKRRVLAEVGAHLPPEAAIGSNTSSLLCTPLAEASGRPDRFFNMNFSDPTESPLVEYMGGARTSQATREFAFAWARQIGAVVIEVRREQRGYAFNRLWRVIKKEVLRQLDAGVVRPDELDRAWMLGFGTAMGPCGMMDRVGLRTVLAIEASYFAESGDISDAPPALLRRMVEAGRLGVESGAGFYDYPDPAYARPGFLRDG